MSRKFSLLKEYFMSCSTNALNVWNDINAYGNGYLVTFWSLKRVRYTLAEDTEYAQLHHLFPLMHK